MGTCYSKGYLIFQISLLKPFYAGGDGYSNPTAVYVEVEQVWEVGGELQHKGPGGRRKHLVAYSGYDESEACWLPNGKLCNSLETLNNYKVSHGLTWDITEFCQLWRIMHTTLE